MKLLFDLSATQRSPIAKFHGGSEYAKYVFEYAVTTGYSNFSVVYNKGYELDEKIATLVEVNNLPVFYASNPDEVKLILRKNGFDSFYSAMPYHYGTINEAHFIMVLHGLRKFEMPFDAYQHVYQNKRYRRLISRLKISVKELFFKSGKQISNESWLSYKRLFEGKKISIITDSSHSRYSILNYFPMIKNDQIKDYPAPLSFEVKKYDSSLDKDYYLLISANRWQKNSYRAIAALDNLLSKGLIQGKSIVVLGAKENSFLYSKIKNKEFFNFKDYVSKEELESYFQHAFCLIYPTLNEGFGYPPLEAMKYEVPTICGGNSSLFQVYGDSVSFTDARSISEIETRILQMELDTRFRDNLILRGKKFISSQKDYQDKSMGRMMKFIFKEK